MTTTGFLTTETAQHPLHTRGRWLYLLGYVLTRLGLVLSVLGVVAAVSGRLAWGGFILPGFALTLLGDRIQDRGWWHVAPNRTAEPARWRAARVVLTVAALGAGLAIAALWLPRGAVGAAGVYLAVAALGFVTIQAFTRRQLTPALTTQVIETAGLLAVTTPYLFAMSGTQARLAVTGGLAVAILVHMLPRCSHGLLVSAGGMNETVESSAIRTAAGQDLPIDVIRYVTGDRSVLVRYRVAPTAAAGTIWAVLVGGGLRPIDSLIGGMVVGLIIGGCAWLMSTPALRR